ncbi:MAG TPA: tetratricopeptide repeat protein [Panacibacter sp.]|nr:tetratricopeptide repeat protein [Panacibacter sp.]
MDDALDSQVLKDKIDQLNIQAWEIRVNNSTQAHVLSREAFELAESIDYSKGKAEGYRTFAFSLIRLSKHHEALEYCEKALALFEFINDVDGQSSIYGYYGIIQRSLGNYAGSLEFLFKFLEMAQQTGNKEAECLCYYHLGVTYKYLGDNEKALNYSLQCLSAGQPKSITYWISKALSLKQIGLIYFETEDFANALKYFKQSLPFTQDAGDKWGEAGCLDNIGFCHFKMKQYEDAIEFCSKALSISKDIDDKKGQGNALFHLGHIYKKAGDYNQAAEYCNSCLVIRREIGDKKGEAEILLFLATLYIRENLSEQSSHRVFELLNNALQLGEEIKAVDMLAKIHLGFYEACKFFNRFQEALTHIEKYIGLSKKIDSDAINEKIRNLEISLKAAETDKKLVQTLLENQKIVEVERTRIAKDLHDGLGGLLSGIKLTLSSMKGNVVVSGENANTFNRAINQLDNTIVEMRRVAHSMMPEALLKFGLSEAIQDYCDGINESNRVKMKFTQLGLRQNLEKTTEVILYRIVQELSNNALKHAAAKNIFIQLTKHERGITLTIEDDGKGFDAANLSTFKGAGLKNVQSRVDYLKGSFEIQSSPGNGSSFTIEIPV